MKEILCYKCKKSNECSNPFPWTECSEYEERLTNEKIIRLFYGMSKTMQKSVLEIMEITQGRADINENSKG